MDSDTGRALEAKAKVVIVAASTLESARLLLLSKSAQHPNGIGNSSGHVGHNFCEHVMGPSVVGLVKDRIGKPKTIDDGRPGGFYVPRFRNLSDKRPDFVRGYGFEGSAGSTMFPEHATSTPGFGRAFKKQVRDYGGAYIEMGGFGEVLARYENQVDLDPVRTDKWGIPVLRFNYRFGDNEKKMCADMAATAQEMFETAGFEVLEVRRELLTEGWSIHELGTSRMGADPEDVGAEPVPAVPRRQESVRRGRQQPRERVLPESDLDNHGARVAVVRLPGGRAEERTSVMADESKAGAGASDLTRREVIKLGAAAAVAVSMGGEAPAAQTPAPTFFTQDEFALVDELSEIIIPTDEHSPGARAAKVAAYIDARLAETFEAEDKTRFREGLREVDRLSQEVSGAPFMRATADQRVAILTRLAEHEKDPQSIGDRFFVDLKTRVVEAYYSSEIGIKQEMEYKGNVYLAEFVGTDVSGDAARRK